MDPGPDQHHSDLWTWVFRTLGIAIGASVGAVALVGAAVSSLDGDWHPVLVLGPLVFAYVLVRAEAPARRRADADLPR